MSAYVANNPLLYNAALAGIIAASGAGQTAGSAGPTLEAVAAALPLAQAIDTAITGDTTITSGGATIVPSTAAFSNAETSKSAAMFACAFAAMEGQSNASGALPAAAQAAIAAGVVAKYTALIGAPFSLL